MAILLYKKAYFSMKKFNSSLPSVVSFLQEYDDVVLEEIANDLPPIREIEHQIDLYLKLLETFLMR